MKDYNKMRSDFIISLFNEVPTGTLMTPEHEFELISPVIAEKGAEYLETFNYVVCIGMEEFRDEFETAKYPLVLTPGYNYEEDEVKSPNLIRFSETDSLIPDTDAFFTTFAEEELDMIAQSSDLRIRKFISDSIMTAYDFMVKYPFVHAFPRG